MKSTLQFCGGVGAVTGANFLLSMDVGEVKPYKILVDCGLLQGVPHAENFNRSEFPYNPSQVDVLFITHAHADHIGRIPKLIKDGFRGVIYSTPSTLDLSKVMLDDALAVMSHDATSKGVLPMYEKIHVETAISLWKTVPYYEKFEIRKGIGVVLKNSGHILGSAMVEITRNGRTIVFTGDLGNSPSLFLRDTDPVLHADYMVMESVYGDRNHESKEERKAKLEDLVKKTIAKRKTLVIPVFSLERTQDMLYELNDMVESGRINPIPVFIDSPLGIKVTDIYRKWSSEFKPEIQDRIKRGDDIFDFTKLKLTARREDSVNIENSPSPKIIMAGSGMSSGGRIVYHEMKYLPDPEAIICFVGYQSLGTLGRQIQDGAESVDIGGNVYPIKAEVATIDGYSSHKDSDHLVDFVAHPEKHLSKVFVAMGEPKSAMFLTQRLRDYAGVDAVFPALNSIYDLNL